PLTVDVTTPTSGAGAAEHFFPVTRWQGNPTVFQIDPNLAANLFGAGSPHPSIPADQFSAIYSGKITPAADGGYSFRQSVDDQGLFFLSGGALADQTLVTSNANPEGSASLTGGMSYDFVFLASEDFG